MKRLDSILYSIACFWLAIYGACKLAAPTIALFHSLTFEQALAVFCVGMWIAILIGLTIHAAVSPNEVRKP